MTQSHKLQHEPVRARRCRGLPNAGERISKQRTLCAQGLHHRSGSPWSQSEVCHWTTTTSGSGHDSRKNLVFVVGANSAKEWDLVSFEESRIWVELGVLLEYFGAVSSCVSVQRYPPPFRLRENQWELKPAVFDSHWFHQPTHLNQCGWFAQGRKPARIKKVNF